jgi:predicted ATPase
MGILTDRITRLSIRGFKSIAKLDDFDLQPVNVFIGPNAAGKSNFIALFRLLNEMMTPPGQLQSYVQRAGGANAILHGGVRNTRQLDIQLALHLAEIGSVQCRFLLGHAGGDQFFFESEDIRVGNSDSEQLIRTKGHREAKLLEFAESGNPRAQRIRSALGMPAVYHFHDTSATSRIRQQCSLDNNVALSHDGANLGPFLLRLRDSRPEFYRRILETIRQAAPFFAEFVLKPQNQSILLRWRERDSDVIFGPHQASDGSLRLFALISLLLQPEDELPKVVVIDEPELGLHPSAISIIAGLLKSVSHRVQVIVATQSVNFINYFDPEDIVVVERPKHESVFHRLDATSLSDWLAEYSLAELWEKNVIGGRP